MALEHLARTDIEAGRGLLLIDLKGERALTQAVHEAAVAAGRGADFRLFTFDGPSHSYNPIARGDGTAIRDRILSGCIWSDEVFYKQVAKTALSRILGAMMAKGGAFTFRDLELALVDKDALTLLSRFVPVEDARRILDDVGDFSRFQKHTASLLDNVSEFAAAEFRDRLCQPYADIDLAEAAARNLIVVFELNSQMRPKAAQTLARMALEDLKHVAGSRTYRPDTQRPFHVYIDEAGRGVYEGFVGLISQCRSARIGLTLAAQSPLDFDTAEGKLKTTVLQNTGTKIIFRQLDHESAELCANLGGTYETVERTSQLLDEGLLGVNPTGMHSEKQIDKYVAHPNVLKTLRTGRAFLVEATGKRAFVDICPPPPRSQGWQPIPVPPPASRVTGPVLDLPRLLKTAGGSSASPASVGEENAGRSSAPPARPPQGKEARSGGTRPPPLAAGVELVADPEDFPGARAEGAWPPDSSGGGTEQDAPIRRRILRPRVKPRQ